MTICKGCGAVLQNEFPDQAGYTPKIDAEYCRRCFRLIHYDDLTVSMRTGIDPDMVLNEIAARDALVLWVVDLFDFEAGMIPGLTRKIGDRDIIMVCSKRDILPDTLSHEKIARFVFGRLKELGIHIKGLIMTSKDNDGIQEVKDAVTQLASMRLCGNATTQLVIPAALVDSESTRAMLVPGGRLYDQRKATTEELSKIEGVSFEMNHAAFYLFPRIDEKIYDFDDGHDFAMKFLHEKHVLVIPGSGFDWFEDIRVRIVMLPYAGELRHAMQEMGDFLQHHRR